MANPWENNAVACSDPAGNWLTVTLADVVLTDLPRAICCGTAGFVDIESEAGTTSTIYISPGVLYPVRPAKVKPPTSGTAALDVVVFW